MTKPAIELRSASYSYCGSDVLHKCDLLVPERSITALLGLNGAGKTTMFRCLLKQLQAGSNTVLIEGQDINVISTKDIAKRISFVPQINKVIDTDCLSRSYIVEGRTPLLKNFSVPQKDDYFAAEQCAKTVGCQNLLGKKLSQLSGGEMQLVMVARALAQDTPILLMDEPMSALDIHNQVKILKLIRQLNDDGKTIIFSTHNPNHALALDCDAAILHDGQIYRCGKASEILSCDVVQTVYGANTYVHEIAGRKYCEIDFI